MRFERLVLTSAFYEAASASGHEGVMAKALDAPYDAGNRGAAWLKIKKVRRLGSGGAGRGVGLGPAQGRAVEPAPGRSRG